MKTPEDEAFDDLARKQGMWGGGFPAKRQMAADKQEPWNEYEWRNAAIMFGEKLASVGPVGYYEMDANEWLDWAMKNVNPQIEFAPVKMVAYNCKCGRTMKFESEHGVIAPKREWVGLTDEETSGFTQHEMTVAKYVSKVLQEKNT